MRILITGTEGFLGYNLYQEMNKRGFDVWGSCHPNHKKFVENSISRLIAWDINFSFPHVSHFDMIIHCAGKSNVDWAQQNPVQAFEVGVSNIRKLLNSFGKDIIFVFISSNAVYSGNEAPYTEQSEELPINIYGEYKLKAEKRIKELFKTWLIVRPILIYGWNKDFIRDNVLSYSLKKLYKEESIKVVNDVFSTPICIHDCAEFIIRLILREKFNDLYLLGGPEKFSLYQFVNKAAKCLNLNEKLIEEISSKDFFKLAKRPKDCSYDISKVVKDTNYQPKILEKVVLERG